MRMPTEAGEASCSGLEWMGWVRSAAWQVREREAEVRLARAL